ncbi:hypothetical protein [Nakamurella aerolata]|uniref:Uncharacterized protein n=1 Tax=Nakamurella aerolata TaxID=1656892 RepID=A0A849AEC1_9ACTN|nr:hypothetical protein [Nakamurella aerolata]NNG37561.1 hypothetical protein [Nakamurella aerolata]
MSENPAETGGMDASEAARIMQDPNASEEERSVAASALRQSGGRSGETSPEVASEAERSVAASDLSQADKQRDQRSKS